MKKKNITGIFLVMMLFLVLFTISLPTTVKAYSYGDYRYKIINNNSEVEITGYQGTGGDIVIPSEIEGKPVTSIGYSAFYFKNLTSIIIPDSVISIGNSAFKNNQLTSVIIPDSVTSIGNSAFRFNKLTSVTIPESVISIGDNAFEFNSLESIDIPNSVTSIGDSAFSTNKLTSVTIPNSITSIGNYVFWQNQLTSVTIPDSVTSIGERAFRYNRLTSITVPNSVTFIGADAFYRNQLNPKDFIIYGEPGSCAEYYANDYGHTFISLNVTSVSLNITELQMAKGTTRQLIATVLPENATNKNISWLSSNPSVARVNEEGVVTAVSQGEATIVVTTEDGNHTASCKVIVEKPILLEELVGGGKTVIIGSVAYHIDYLRLEENSHILEEAILNDVNVYVYVKLTDTICIDKNGELVYSTDIPKITDYYIKK